MMKQPGSVWRCFWLGLLLVGLLASACLPDATVIPDFLAPTNTFQVRLSETPPPPDATATNSPTSQPCGFQWATQPLAEISARAQAALDDAGLEGSVRAEAFGENCLNADMSVQYFTTSETDFRFMLEVSALSDRAALGDLAAAAVAIVERFPVDDVPGTQPGYIGIAFSSGEQTANLWFSRQQGVDALAQGLSGEAFYQAVSEK